MSVQADSSAHAPHVVGNAFVQRYYTLLYEAPQEVHNFYQEGSVLSRPGADGIMVSVTTRKEISDHIMAFDYQSTKVQILTADSQDSYKNGVIVLVTGFLIGKDNLRRKFTQSFFLVPQQQTPEKRYFVLNDVFRYVDENESVVPVVNDVEETAPVAPLTPDNELTQTPEQPLPDLANNSSVTDADNGKESVNPVNHEVATSTDTSVAHFDKAEIAPSSQDNSHVVSSRSLEYSTRKSGASTEVDSSKASEEAPKKSYASILAEKANARASVAKPEEKPRAIRKPAEQPRAANTKLVEQTQAIATASVGNNSSEKNNAGGISIFVANLPMNATDVQLTETFSKFGVIKRDGVQVRSQKLRGNCFGFVEFESAVSVQNVLQAYRASAIMIGGRKVSIEVKRGNSDVAKFSSGGRGGYRNENGYRSDNFRGRGNFNGPYNHGKYDHEKQRNSQSEARPRSGEPNAKVYQNGTRHGQDQGAQK